MLGWSGDGVEVSGSQRWKWKVAGWRRGRGGMLGMGLPKATSYTESPAPNPILKPLLWE